MTGLCFTRLAALSTLVVLSALSVWTVTTQQNLERQPPLARALQTTIGSSSSSPGTPTVLPPIISTTQTEPRNNAIVYLVQKKHSSYGRDSYELLLKSLDLFYENYLLIDNHYKNAHIFLFHTGDFDLKDLQELESRYPEHTKGTMRLVDLNNSEFWSTPDALKDEDPADWKGAWLHAIGYRHMIRWYALKIWDFFHYVNVQQNANYKYVMRLDEDSFIYSPIDYDMFDFMQHNGYYYGYRMLSYEMSVINGPWDDYIKEQAPEGFTPYREFRRSKERGGGFYNNWSIASIEFFRSDPVQNFLRFIDNKGYMYRNRLGDLQIQSAAVYAFCEPARIHRFLDFTYEHFTLYKNSGCPMWGAIEGGYKDPNAEERINQYRQDMVERKCQFRNEDRKFAAQYIVLTEEHLSPTYAHIPPEWKGKVRLPAISAGLAEQDGKGSVSG